MTSAKDLLKGFLEKDLRSLSRLISLSENKDDLSSEILAEVFGQIGHSRVIGFTGPPGAGKSTLTSHFVKLIREQNKTVAVVAVDPVSPFSGGALLGDRIRLVDHFNDSGVFIRSLSTRGKLGGLSLATRQVVHLLDAFGFDFILLETVGVGQSEIDVRNIADATLLVLVPEWGDSIQTIKAGILEIGDIFVVNKSDRDGADKLLTELKLMLQMAHRESSPLLLSNHQDEDSLRTLFGAVLNFFETKINLINSRRATASIETANELMTTFVAREAIRWIKQNNLPSENPYRFYQDFLKKHPAGTLFRT
jgi:LAO/AO transport system kinase